MPESLSRKINSNKLRKSKEMKSKAKMKEKKNQIWAQACWMDAATLPPRRECFCPGTSCPITAPSKQRGQQGIAVSSCCPEANAFEISIGSLVTAACQRVGYPESRVVGCTTELLSWSRAEFKMKFVLVVLFSVCVSFCQQQALPVCICHFHITSFLV